MEHFAHLTDVGRQQGGGVPWTDVREEDSGDHESLGLTQSQTEHSIRRIRDAVGEMKKTSLRRGKTDRLEQHGLPVLVNEFHGFRGFWLLT